MDNGCPPAWRLRWALKRQLLTSRATSQERCSAVWCICPVRARAIRSLHQRIPWWQRMRLRYEETAWLRPGRGPGGDHDGVNGGSELAVQNQGGRHGGRRRGRVGAG